MKTEDLLKQKGLVRPAKRQSRTTIQKSKPVESGKAKPVTKKPKTGQKIPKERKYERPIRLKNPETVQISQKAKQKSKPAHNLVTQKFETVNLDRIEKNQPQTIEIQGPESNGPIIDDTEKRVQGTIRRFIERE